MQYILPIGYLKSKPIPFCVTELKFLLCILTHLYACLCVDVYCMYLAQNTICNHMHSQIKSILGELSLNMLSSVNV